MVQHVQVHRVDISKCPVCRKYVGLSYQHVKCCTAAKCPVLYCSTMKFKIQKHPLQLTLQQARNQQNC